VLNFLPGYGSEIGDYLVSDARTRFISFTGSMKTGLRINELAAKQQEGQRWIKRVIVETGGKDALVVDDSADLDSAAEDLVKSAYGYAGQMVVEKTRALNVGVPNNPEVFMGPVQNEAQFEKVANYIEVGDEEAERVLGENPGDGGQGYFVKPTIYSEVDSEARIAREEIFGPVLSVLKARDFDEALKIANDTPYGLTGGVYSRNRDHLEQARTEFKAGNIYFNRGITGALVGVQPFGGYGLSGTDSKAGGPDYLPLHMLPRTVVERF
jgi:1-pyrroline-5-carboxylate dehydrogenase